MDNPAKEISERLRHLNLKHDNSFADDTAQNIIYMLVEEYGPIALGTLHKKYITHFDNRTKREFTNLVQHWIDNRNFIYQGMCLRLTTAAEKQDPDRL